MKRNLVAALAGVVALALVVATGVVVDRAGEARTEELLERIDALTSGRDAELDDIHRVVTDVAASLDERPCSPRVLSLAARLLPERWELNAADIRAVRGGGALESVRIRDGRSPSATKRLSC